MSAIYKPGQGRYARVGAGVFIALFAAYGCSSLGRFLGTTSLDPVFVKVIPVAVFLALMVALAFALNYARLADFLIETEIEMGRVIWPTRREVIVSSMVVIITVVVMAAFLYGADRLLLVALRAIRLYE